jgi:hypothetical protein
LINYSLKIKLSPHKLFPSTGNALSELRVSHQRPDALRKRASISGGKRQTILSRNKDIRSTSRKCPDYC